MTTTATREVATSSRFSVPAVTFAVLASVVGAVVTDALGTDQLGRLAGAAIGPVVTATFTTWWTGGRGRIQLGAICSLSALALVITISGFFVADTVADEPVLGSGSGSLAPSNLVGADSTDTSPVTDGDDGVVDPPVEVDLAVDAGASTDGVGITIINVGEAAAGGFVVSMNDDDVHTNTGGLPPGASESITASCLDTPPGDVVIEVRFLDDQEIDPNAANNVASVTNTCPDQPTI